MAIKKKVPEIRFRGFSGEWEEKRLGEYADNYYGGGTPVTSLGEYWDGDIPWIQSSDIVDEQLSNISPRKKITQKGVKSSATKLVPENSIAIVTRVGVGKLALLPFLYATSQDFLSLSNLRVDRWFGVYSIWKKIKNELYAVQGTSIKGITKDELLRKLMFVPKQMLEQSQIGSFFQQIDSLITLHQRKYDKLVTVKKAMLGKMFPKDGSDVPEIRYKGFAGKWEKKDLGQIYKERNERGNESLPILSVSIHSGISNGELDADSLGKQVRRSEDKSLYKRVYTGDLVFNMMRAWQGAVGVSQSDGMVSPAYVTAIPSAELFPPFMDCCLRRESVIDQMNNLSYGVTDFRKRLYWDSFVRVTCRIPSVPEQQKIAAYFANLDSLIALQQCELDKLKNIKKACLEKMFV
jgi:type I restriction enzyme S subunit